METSGDIRFDRAVLTGEADEIEGAVDATNENILESRNIALMGTYVTNGNGKGVVILSGGNSVMGRINKLTFNTKIVPTLIQKEMTRFVKIIVALTVCLASLIFFVWLGWLRRDHFGFINVVGMLNNVMGCVVAFIPEGMPMAVTLTLSLVARRMKAAKVLPKSLSVVETLGCVNVICSDKTGTLTQNRMFVVVHTASGTEPHHASSKRVFCIPFNSKNKWMLTMHQKTDSTDEEKGFRVYVKGAPDILSPACTSYWSKTENTI